MSKGWATRIVVVSALFAGVGCNDVVGWNDLPETKDSPARGEAIKVATATLSAEHACAIVAEDSSARCWGRNDKGQLGAGSTDVHRTPVTVLEIEGVKSIDTGLIHTCATDSRKSVWCWGSNRYGALGRGKKDEDAHPKPERVALAESVNRVHCGMNFSCAVTTAKRVTCWGDNAYGQLGDGAGGVDRSRFTPQPVGALKGVEVLSASNQHACAVALDDANARAVFCWGSNDHRQLGDGPDAVLNPTIVKGLDDPKSVVTGDQHTCALLANGTVSCWGANDRGQLGRPPSADDATPTVVPGLEGVESLGVGSKHTCGTSKGKLYCWGDNTFGQIGRDLEEVKFRAKPSAVSSELLGSIKDGKASGRNTCAALPSGELFCWGLNDHGQLGDGTTKNSPTPVAVRY